MNIITTRILLDSKTPPKKNSKLHRKALKTILPVKIQRGTNSLYCMAKLKNHIKHLSFFSIEDAITVEECIHTLFRLLFDRLVRI